MSFFINNSRWLLVSMVKYRIHLIIAGFLVYVSFFDEYNIKTRYKLSRTTSRLVEQKETFVKLISQAKQDKLDLEQNYEKFAREKFIMSRPDEDVFIIEGRQIKQ